MKKLFLIILFLIIVGCDKSSLDLSTIDLGADANKYNLDKISDLSIVPDSPTKDLINYFSKESKALNYAKIPIDSSWSTSTNITVYKNKIASLDISTKGQGFVFAKKLIKKLGKPAVVAIDRVDLSIKIKDTIFNQLKSIFPNDTRWEEDYSESTDRLYYPQMLFWEKGNVYYIFAMKLDSDGEIKTQYLPITKEALRANVVFGFKYPLDKESPLYNYLK